MRLSLIACLLVTWSAGARAEGTAAPVPAIACESLVTLRRLMAREPEGGAVPPEFTGCRAIPADTIGDVEKRAMIGDAPYECRSVPGGPCLWVRP